MRHVLVVGYLLCVDISFSRGHAGLAWKHHNVEVSSNGDIQLQSLDAAFDKTSLVRRQTVYRLPPANLKYTIYAIQPAGAEYLDSQKDLIEETLQWGISCCTCASSKTWSWDDPGNVFVLTQVNSNKVLTLKDHHSFATVKLDDYVPGSKKQRWVITRSGNTFTILSPAYERLLICDRSKPAANGRLIKLLKLSKKDPTSDVWKWNITLDDPEALEAEENQTKETEEKVEKETEKANEEISKAAEEISKAEKEMENAENKIEKENVTLRQKLSEAETIVAAFMAFGPMLLAFVLGSCRQAAPPPASAPAVADPLPVAQEPQDGASGKQPPAAPPAAADTLPVAQ